MPPATMGSSAARGHAAPKQNTPTNQLRLNPANETPGQLATPTAIVGDAYRHMRLYGRRPSVANQTVLTQERTDAIFAPINLAKNNAAST